MDQTALVTDIVTTQNTLTILQHLFTMNQASLHEFSTIFHSIGELNDILTHSSVKQIENALFSHNNINLLKELQDTLNKVSDAVTTKDTSIITTLQETLSTYVEKFQIYSSSSANNGETGEEIFKDQFIKCRKPNVSARRSCCSCCSCKCCWYYFKSGLMICGGLMCIFCALGSPSSGDVVPPKPYLMISYSWDSQQVCTEIYKSLKNDDYEVWFDIEHMHGNTFSATAQAVEDADIILVCITKKYSQSRNCQAEAEYAWVKQKTMIFLLLQPKYKPTGWLGNILGAKLYIDFTKNEFPTNYKKLIGEIKGHSKDLDGSNKNDVLPTVKKCGCCSC
jgi:hypothetical protein